MPFVNLIISQVGAFTNPVRAYEKTSEDVLFHFATFPFPAEGRSSSSDPFILLRYRIRSALHHIDLFDGISDVGFADTVEHLCILFCLDPIGKCLVFFFEPFPIWGIRHTDNDILVFHTPYYSSKLGVNPSDFQL